jgi:RNA polymerase sigma factor (sigma-70 family)
MAELTPRQRQMVDMQFQEELTVTEIARRLGVNKSTVSRCLRRARQRLYSRLRFTL